MLAKKIQWAHSDTEVFKLTGCLSNCDKYHYVAKPTSTERIDHKSDSPSLLIKFVIPKGQNELKEQVKRSL